MGQRYAFLDYEGLQRYDQDWLRMFDLMTLQDDEIDEIFDNNFEPEPFIFTVEITDSNKTTGIPFTLYNCYGTLRVDWGDGTNSILTKENYTSYDDTHSSTHVYEENGLYKVSVRCDNWKRIYFIDNSASDFSSTSGLGECLIYWRKTAYSIDSAIPLTSNKSTDFTGIFRSFQSLTKVSSHTFENYPNLTSLKFCFRDCRKLQDIPSGLFDKNTLVTDFTGCFANCIALISVPKDLFKYNTRVEYICYEGGYSNDATKLFYNCKLLTSIPAGLFDSFTLVKSFHYCFAECKSLASIPAGLFDNCTAATNFEYCFMRCPITSIPSGLFDNCTAATTFDYCFGECKSLASIPAGLFDNCTAATNFSFCFDGTSITSIPAGLFDNCTAATTFYGCFGSCSSLITIPSGLFDKNTATTSFYRCFEGCSSLASIPSGLFDKNTKVTTFYGCFSGCTSLQSIPSGLFSKNTAVTTFYNCFNYCSSLNNFTIHIGSSKVSNCEYFVTLKSGTTRKVYVPSGSTTQTKFNNVASSLGLTIIGE